jgi:hypothetical protein
MAGQVTLQTRIDSYDPMPKYVARLTNSRVVALSKTRESTSEASLCLSSNSSEE